MRQKSIQTWLRETEHVDRIILTDKYFSQKQIERQLHGFSPLRNTQCFTFQQWQHHLFITHPIRQAALLTNIHALGVFHLQLKSKRTIQQRHQDFKKYIWLNRYDALPDQVHWPELTDQSLNLEGLSDYQDQLIKNNFLDLAMLLNWLNNQSPHVIFKEVLLATNQPLSPKEYALIRRYSKRVCQLVCNEKAEKPVHTIYLNITDELHGTICSIATEYKKNPYHSYGIILPKNQCQLKWRTLLSYYLSIEPSSIMCSKRAVLLKQPMIRNAMSIIETLGQQQINLQHWIQMLLTNSIQISSSAEQNDFVIKALSQIRRLHLPWPKSSNTYGNDAALFFEKIIRTQKILHDSEEYSKRLYDILNEWNWHEIFMQQASKEAHNCWHNAWRDWRILYQSLQIKCIFEALNWLKLLLSHSHYALNKSNGNISILFNDEISGSYFDKVWLVSADHIEFPKLNMPYNDIPDRVIKQCQIPTPNCQLARVFIKTLFSRSSNRLNSSHAKMVNNTTRQISPCVDYKQIVELHNVPHLYAHYFKAKLVSEVDQTRYFPKKLSASLLKDYSQCHFKGFAKNVLNATFQEPASDSLSASLRGIILHESLARIWLKVRNSSNLAKMSDDEKKQHIKNAVSKVFEHHRTHFSWPLPDWQTNIEFQLLVTSITEWLDIEAQRPSFSVSHIEHQIEFIINKFKFKMRIDRIDKTLDGNLILDYKSGYASVSDWFDERPENPQMLIYLLSQQPQVIALAYAHISAQKIKISGISHQNIQIAGITAVEKIKFYDSWHDMLKCWESNIIQLINATQTKHLHLNPKTIYTCQNCHLTSLCRIKEYRDNRYETD